MKYTVFCFSPTGGTRRIADEIAAVLSCDVTDITVSADERRLSAEDLAFFCFPVYGGRIPVPVYDRMERIHGSNTPAVTVAVYGNRAVDDALLEMSDLCQKHGFYTAAAGEMIAPHSVDPSFATDRPDADDLQQLRAFVSEVAERTAYVPVSVPGNPDYLEYGGIPIKPIGLGHCLHCGQCVQNCPVGAIPVKHPKRTDLKKCISCMRCVHVCRSGVRQVIKPLQLVAKKSLGKYCSGRKEPRFFTQPEA